MTINIEKSLSNALYVVDPAYTCCYENQCTDEYDRTAKRIIELAQVVSLEDAIKEIFNDYFEIELSDEVVNRICDFPIR